MSLLACVDGVLGARVPADDRAFAYGDGLFETLRIVDSEPVWWNAHLERMRRGAERLGIAMPAEAVWQQDLCMLAAQVQAAWRADGVLKLVLSRGSSQRGYAVDAGAAVRRLSSLAAAPPSAAQAEHGLRVQVSDWRLPIQPALSGIKHLNRLDQVMARRACDAAACDEAVLLDSEGFVVSAIAGNLVWRDDAGWHTPPVDRSGVAGCCRGWGLQAGVWDVQPLAAAQLDDIRQVAVCNSVRGILPVAQLGARDLPVDGELRDLQRRLAADLPAFHHPFLGNQ